MYVVNILITFNFISPLDNNCEVIHFCPIACPTHYLDDVNKGNVVHCQVRAVIPVTRHPFSWQANTSLV